MGGDNRAKKRKNAGDARGVNQRVREAWSRFMGVFGGRSCGKRGSADYVECRLQLSSANPAPGRNDTRQPLHHQLGAIPTALVFPQVFAFVR